jgi:DNA-damage-inducible protein D
MQAKYPKTPHQAFSIAHSAGVETREAMKKIGGVMPEKMPVAEGIGEAKKRLKTNKPLLEKD